MAIDINAAMESRARSIARLDSNPDIPVAIKRHVLKVIDSAVAEIAAGVLVAAVTSPGCAEAVMRFIGEEIDNAMADALAARTKKPEGA